MIIRELIASLGIDFDKRGADSAKASIESVRKSMGLLQDAQGRWRQANGQFATDAQLASAGVDKVGAAASRSSGHINQLLSGLGLFGAWAGFGKLVDEAANADDYMNVLRETFKENADGVVAWSQETATAMSRSEFEMRKMAGAFGSFLTPMLDGNREMSAEMSKTLTALSVDLSSFYADMTDEQAMEKLFSGMAGETEAVRRLGIDLSEAGLQEYAHAQGIAKKVKAMTAAEKTQLRYKKILKDTVDKQGDAIRTADTYENRLKALKASVQTLSVAVGGQFVHAIEGMLGGLRGAVEWVKNLVQSSNIAGGVLVALGVATAAWGIGLAVANWPLLLLVAGLGAIAAAGDELISWFRGDGSLIGDFIDKIGGKGASAETVNAIKEAWQGLGQVLKDAKPYFAGAFDVLLFNAKLLLKTLEAIGKALGGFAASDTGGGDLLSAAKNVITGHPLDAAGNLVDAAGKQAGGFRNAYNDASTAFGGPRKFTPPSLPTVAGRGAYDMLKGTGIPGDNIAPVVNNSNYTINLQGPQSRESVDQVERMARDLASSTRRGRR